MKPAPFKYVRPTTRAGVLTALAEAGEDGKVLAGGQSLIPLLSMRLASPKVLVDINLVPEFSTLRVSPTHVEIGPTVRHQELLTSEAVREAVPLLAQALSYVAHPVIRNRGTSVGSIAHADPSGELTAVLSLLDGVVTIESKDGTREISGSEFFLGPLESAVNPGEIATRVTFGRLPKTMGTACVEVSRRHGDYAIVGVCAAIVLGEEHQIDRARVSLFSVGPTPIVIDVSEVLKGVRIDGQQWLEAARFIASNVDPDGDIHATGAYRKNLVEVLSKRGLESAYKNALDRVAVEQ
jgi:carbon-monoxide dehydrogenase medium subunit